MEADYLQAAMPEPVTIMGQRLRAFSLGHAKLLRRFGNAFFCGRSPELSDLVFGVFVCSQSSTEALEALSRGVPVRGWFGRTRYLSYADFVRAWCKSIGAFDVDAKCAEFADYLRAGSIMPELHNPERESRMPGAPFVQRVEQTLVTKLGYSREQAIDCPWGLAMHEYWCYWELEGSCKIVSEDDMRQRMVHERILAEIAAEETANA